MGGLGFKFLMDSVKCKDLTRTYTVDGFIQVLQLWTRVLNYVAKEISEMFHKWDNDNTYVAVEKLVNFMVASKGFWKWTQECWAVEGTKPMTNLVYVKQEPPQWTVKEERRTRKRAHTEVFMEALKEPPVPCFFGRERSLRQGCGCEL
ncbi:hypothetical protein F2Q70_00017424 [Brassica cretica]|uniref:Uncharacterized protein n=1 Tax=Brassica cretica TaxID=69181 RepID=A0A3N6PZR1_BRACR|nr:hypothetical protein F2Q70_00017424 [Brassica cretica]KAF2596786.1 hypothetical protein F2Q68_00010386 [Brassica cretica]